MNEIIQAAVDEFLENGYDAASMEAIAKRAGVSKGGLYHHFRRKSDILLYANQKLHEPISEIRLAAEQNTSAAAGLAWYIRSYLEYWHGRKRELVFYSLSMAKMLDSPELCQMYAEYMENFIDYLMRLFEKGIASGELKPHATRDNAMLLMAALDGIAMYLIIADSLDLEAVISLFQNKFVYIYLNKNPQSKNLE